MILDIQYKTNFDAENGAYWLLVLVLDIVGKERRIKERE